MSKLTEQILFFIFVRILKFVKICEFQEFLKFIKFEFSIYVASERLTKKLQCATTPCAMPVVLTARGIKVISSILRKQKYIQVAKVILRRSH